MLLRETALKDPNSVSLIEPIPLPMVMLVDWLCANADPIILVTPSSIVILFNQLDPHFRGYVLTQIKHLIKLQNTKDTE